MTALLDRIEREAMALSWEERERLVQDLIAGLESRPVSAIDQAWIDEAERRYDELVSGRVQGVPAEQVLREARERLLGDMRNHVLWLRSCI